MCKAPAEWKTVQDILDNTPWVLVLGNGVTIRTTGPEGLARGALFVFDPDGNEICTSAEENEHHNVASWFFRLGVTPLEELLSARVLDEEAHRWIIDQTECPTYSWEKEDTD